MRIWHEQLIPKLCQKHLCGLWREANGCYAIVTQGKKGYANHPATKEFAEAPSALYNVLRLVREEMLKRGYHPKELPAPPRYVALADKRKPWQSLSQQIEILKAKGCKCKVTPN